MQGLKKLKISRFDRNYFLAKSFFRLLPKLLTNKTIDPIKALEALVGKDTFKFVDDVGQLKGSLLKGAQMVAVYAEYYLSTEVKEVLGKVLTHNHFLEWDALVRQVPEKLLTDLEFNTHPLAAASIGQVHLAKPKINKDLLYAVKIQYYAIDKVIDLDLRMLELLIKGSRLFPAKFDFAPILQEIKRVLMLEMNYPREAKVQDRYRSLVKDDPRLIVPQIYFDYCTDKTLTAEYMDAVGLRSSEVSKLSQERRNKLGELILELFLREIFEFHLVQTDAHAGNFLVKIGADEDQLVLLDFGACLEYSSETMTIYTNMLRAIFEANRNLFNQTIEEALQMSAKVGRPQIELLWDYCLMAREAMISEEFDFDQTDLPKRLSEYGQKMVKSMETMTPPHQFIFIDRKIAGLFSILHFLKAKINVRKLFEKYYIPI